MAEGRFNPAFPKPASPSDGVDNDWECMSLQTYLVAHFASAWVQALSQRRGDAGYDDTGAALEAIRLGMAMADRYLEREVQ